MKKLMVFFALIFLLAAACGYASADDVVQGEAIVMIKIDRDGEGEITTEAAYRAADAVALAVGAHVKNIDMIGTRLLGSVSAVITHPEMSAEELIRRLKEVPSVLRVEPNKIYRIAAERRPNDSYYSRLWGMEAIGAPAAWDRITGSDTIYTAMIDTGLAVHDDIKDNIDWDLARDLTKISSEVGESGMTDPNGHGTSVMGIMAAVGNNSKGLAGVCWNVRGIPLKVVTDDGEISTIEINESLSFILDQVRNGRRIASVNMSLGGYESRDPDVYLYSPIGNYLKLLSLENRSPLVSTSAGNDGLEHGVAFPKEQRKYTSGDGPSSLADAGTRYYPSSMSQVLDNVVSVAAIGKQDSSYVAGECSNWSSETVDISAPGMDIFSLYGKQEFATWDGTSVAAPHVAGAAALLAAYMDQLGIEWDGKLLKKILLANTDEDVNPENLWAKETGVPTLGNTPSTVGDYKLSKHGMLRIDKAIEYVESRAFIKTISLDLGASAIDIDASTTVTATVTPTTLYDSRKSITWSAEPSDAVEIKKIDSTTATITGKKIGDVTITATADHGGATATVTLTVKEPVHDTHSWSWKNDETYHWQECTCGQKQNIAKHTATTWNITGTEHSKTCTETNCGRVFAEGAHEAAADAQWQKNGSTHRKLCAVCAAQIASEPHDESTTVYSDGTHHWRSCTKCGEEVGKAAHSWGSTYGGDTLYHWKTCTVSGCGQRSSTPHSRSEWQKDGSQHWRTCTVSGCPYETTQLDRDVHTWSGSVCTKCSYDAADGCAHEDDEKYDLSSHWQVCRKCRNETEHIPHTLVWRDLGANHEQRCTQCSYTDKNGPHSMTRFAFNTLDHWHECPICGASATSSPHDFDEDGSCKAGCGYHDTRQNDRLELKIEFPNGNRWAGKGELAFSAARAPEELLDVMVDLKSISNEHYRLSAAEISTRASGSSLTLTLSEELLASLAPGIHDITMIFSDGYADGSFRITAGGNDDTSGGGSSGGGGCATGAACAAIITIAALAVKRRND